MLIAGVCVPDLQVSRLAWRHACSILLPTSLGMRSSPGHASVEVIQGISKLPLLPFSHLLARDQVGNAAE